MASPEEKKLIFGGDEINGEEAQRYFELVKVEDSIGSIQELQTFFKKPKPRENLSKALVKHKTKMKTTATTSKIIAIEEVETSESEDEDLPTYAKPDSDPEDDDSDPELVQRSKPTAPV